MKEEGGDLGELYRLMLLHHCAAFHPLDALRSAKVTSSLQLLI